MAVSDFNNTAKAAEPDFDRIAGKRDRLSITQEGSDLQGTNGTSYRAAASFNG